MKKVLAFLYTMLLVFCMVGYTGAVTVTFDDLGYAWGDHPTGNEYIAEGITFSTPDLCLTIGTTSVSQQWSLGAGAVYSADFDGGITFEFIDNQYATDVSFYIFNPTFQANAFDSDGTLLTTIIGTSTFTQFFDFSGYNVNRVEIEGSIYAIDDVSFGALYGSGFDIAAQTVGIEGNSVPEPATMLLLASGLVGLAGFRRKFKK